MGQDKLKPVYGEGLNTYFYGLGQIKEMNL